LKKILFLILLTLCLYISAYAQTQKELFDDGVLLFKQGQYQQAIDSFSKLIEIAPGNADAYKNRGVTFMKQEKYDLAIEDFNKAKELFPELKGLYSNLGVAWYYKKEYEKAIENYDIEIEMAPDNAVAYFNRALCLSELNRKTEALDDLSKTLDLQPDFYWALCYKADLLALTGDNKKAIEAYEEAIRQDPQNTYSKEKLDLLRQKLEKKESPDQQKITPENTKAVRSGYAVQTGAFLGQENARKMKKKLAMNGFDSRILVLKDSSDRTWYLVRSGTYLNQTAAQKAASDLKKKLGMESLIRPVDNW